ncbi:angiotensin-converting enzyme [Lucilia cuprina]|uniref:angiotensin-converting enzyme n=1 Tax=Lucilia cuprina TaxID=7375 RepID=UPI001F05607D|nr:angiotensin-converting enzyme [Lucilia cuprina]
MKLLQALLVAVICTISLAAPNNETDARNFVTKASERYYNLYNKIAAETYSSIDDEDFEEIFKKLNNVKTISQELVEISQDAAEFDLSKIKDPQLKRALKKLRKVGNLFVLGEDYFSSFLLNLNSLKSLSTDKDIEPYLGGINMPDQDDSAIAYYPDIQKIFETSNDASELKYYWETWRERNSIWASVNFYTTIEGIQKAAEISEQPVLELYYSQYENKDFLKVMQKVMDEIMPAYKQLHAFIRHELHKKYGSDVVDPNGLIPDHLFEQVLSQVWKEGSVIESYFPFKELPPYDGFVKNYDAKKVLQEAQQFYKSLGFDDLDETFVKDQLKEHDESTNIGDCRADIFDLTPKVYMKYCPKVDFRKFMQMHGYMSRIHYAQAKKDLPAYFFNSYDLEYPVGEAVILSACTPKHLQAIGVAKDFTFTDKTLMNRLFRMGIHTILNVPLFFVHSKVVHDLLNNTIDMDGANKHYWKLMQTYVGTEPPSDREEGSIDFPYKFYLDLEQNYQTKKFVSEILGYQFYRAFCQKAGQTGQLHNCDFYNNKAVGNDLKSMMSLGSTKSWHDVIAKVLDKPDISGDALLEYYAPIFDWVKGLNKQNKVKIGWNDSKKKVL